MSLQPEDHNHPIAMKNPALLIITAIASLLLVVLVLEHQAKVALQGQIGALQTKTQDLGDQLELLQKRQTQLESTPRTTVVQADNPEELARLRAEIARLAEQLARVEKAGAATSNELAAARGPKVPFVYADSTPRNNYAFSGYATPQSGFQSMLWAITQMDAKSYLGSMTDQNLEFWSKKFQEEAPDGVMPGGFRNGAMFKASGYRVVEETPLSQDEVRLKVFLEGARTSIQTVFQRVGNEWKWARNE
jgi:hypothetical protein